MTQMVTLFLPLNARKSCKLYTLYQLLCLSMDTVGLLSSLQNNFARYISLQNWRAMVIGSYPYLLLHANFANCILDCILNMINHQKQMFQQSLTNLFKMIAT